MGGGKCLVSESRDHCYNILGGKSCYRGGSLIPEKLAFTVCTGQEDVVLVSLRLFDCVRMALLPCGQAVFL